MMLSEYKDALLLERPPDLPNALLPALWYDANEQWSLTHSIAQEIESQFGYRVHAYLHRKEGDLWNATYWYRRAGTDLPNLTLDEEWKELVVLLLDEYDCSTE